MSSGDAQKVLKNGPLTFSPPCHALWGRAGFRAIPEALGPNARAGSARASGLTRILLGPPLASRGPDPGSSKVKSSPSQAERLSRIAASLAGRLTLQQSCSSLTPPLVSLSCMAPRLNHAPFVRCHTAMVRCRIRHDAEQYCDAEPHGGFSAAVVYEDGAAASGRGADDGATRTWETRVM
jgi:hypothetical protein